MDVEDDLISRTESDYGELYSSHVLEIYKMYVASADAISSRRQSANSFYLSVNTAVVGVAGFIIDSGNTYGWAVSLAGILLCIAWQRAVRAYKDLNTGKFKVIHEIERNLPISVYSAEWAAIGRGDDANLYLPFTKIEIWIPRIFIILHLLMLMTSVSWTWLSGFWS